MSVHLDLGHALAFLVGVLVADVVWIGFQGFGYAAHWWGQRGMT